MGTLDFIVFIAFIGLVVFAGLYQSRRTSVSEEAGASDYFLAGRQLTWWLVGFSLIAANISTEQFVGMSGSAANWLGMAIASYEWMAAVTLVVVAFVFLPTFLKCGIYTIPEFLEYRYSPVSRVVMAIIMMVILVGVPTASVIFSGAKVFSVQFQGEAFLGLDLGNLTLLCWAIGLLACGYVFAGGLAACAWADLIQGAALIIGGVIIAYLCFDALAGADANELVKSASSASLLASDLEGQSGWSRFWLLNDAPVDEGGKLHMVRPSDDPAIPWQALLIGLWIPNFFYWGLNQYIMQRSLGAKSLAEGQKGIVFAASLKLIIPFIVVIPGILAFNLFNSDLSNLAAEQNRPILEEFQMGSQRVIAFDQDFAEVDPDAALSIFQANALILDESADRFFSAADLATANAMLVDLATDRSLPVTSELKGYDYDAAFPTLLKNLLQQGTGLKGFVLAAIFGAVVSSLASILNSASTIATMDIFHKIRPGSKPKTLIVAGRAFVVLFTLIACFIAPKLDSLDSIFMFLQEFQGFISPGVLSIFIFGLLVPRAPRFIGWFGIVLNVVLYGLLLIFANEIAFLDRMAICLASILVILAVLTFLRPLSAPVQLPVNTEMDLTPSVGAKYAGMLVCVATIALYILFW